MTFFEYKVVPAPRRAEKSRGVSEPEQMFALTLADAINREAREGWEYVRAETMTAEVPRGWLRRSVVEEETVLIFRRERETLGPRIAAVHEHEEGGADAPAVTASRDRSMADRLAGLGRREPRIEGVETASTPASPLRPTPRLGPAEPR